MVLRNGALTYAAKRHATVFRNVQCARLDAHEAEGVNTGFAK
jgi:hypothetical protein